MVLVGKCHLIGGMSCWSLWYIRETWLSEKRDGKARKIDTLIGLWRAEEKCACPLHGSFSIFHTRCLGRYCIHICSKQNSYSIIAVSCAPESSKCQRESTLCFTKTVRHLYSRKTWWLHSRSDKSLGILKSSKPSMISLRPFLIPYSNISHLFAAIAGFLVQLQICQQFCTFHGHSLNIYIYFHCWQLWEWKLHFVASRRVAKLGK